MKPYYEDGAVTIYHANARELLPHLSFDSVLTDPPYGINKAAWDKEFPLWLWAILPFNLKTLGVMPGIWNLLKCPQRVNNLAYRWTLSAALIYLTHKG